MSKVKEKQYSLVVLNIVLDARWKGFTLVFKNLQIFQSLLERELCVFFKSIPSKMAPNSSKRGLISGFKKVPKFTHQTSTNRVNKSKPENNSAQFTRTAYGPTRTAWVTLNVRLGPLIMHFNPIFTSSISAHIHNSLGPICHSKAF